MKFVKKSLSLPEDQAKFAEKQASKDAQKRGAPPNFSDYIRTLLAREMERAEPVKEAA